MMDWYDEWLAEESDDAVGMVEVSRVSVMSCSFAFPSGSRDAIDGDGDNTMEGVLECLGPAVSFPVEEASDGCMVGSQSKPGLIIKFMVSPSFTSYSLRSFVSARAFPLRSKRCASAGGARVWDAR